MKKTLLFVVFVSCILIACTCKRKPTPPSILGLWVKSESLYLDRYGNVVCEVHCNDIFANYYCFHANNTITTKDGKKYSWEIRNDTLIVKRSSTDIKIYRMKLDYRTLQLRCDYTDSVNKDWVTQERCLMRISEADTLLGHKKNGSYEKSSLLSLRWAAARQPAHAPQRP